MNKEKLEFYLDVGMLVLALATIFLLFYEMTLTVPPFDIEALRPKLTGIGIIDVASGSMASYLLGGTRNEKGKEDVEEARRILVFRRARGEVTEEQYAEIKRDLEEMMRKK